MKCQGERTNDDQNIPRGKIKALTGQMLQCHVVELPGSTMRSGKC